MPEDKQSQTANLRKEELERLIEFSPAVHYVAAASGNYGATYVSPGIKFQLGYEPAQFTQDSGFWAQHIHPDDRPKILADLDPLFENDRHTHEYRFQHADGSYRWMHDALVLIRDEDGNPLEIIGSWLDVTAQKEAELELAKRNKQLEYLALYDTLTELGNRNLFLKQLEHLIVIAERKKESVALLAMDIDGFKEVNDRLGHAAGDAVLREFGARLSEALRQADQKYRIGGDEFAVLLEPNRVSLNGALVAAAKLARHLSAPVEIKGHSCSIGVSIGVAVFPQHGDDPTTLLGKADAAMYEAKKTGQAVAQATELDPTDTFETLSADT